MNKTIVLFCILMLSAFFVFAQNHSVKGRVTGPDGNPLPGITVQVKGTNIATPTNTNGEFELNVPSNATLVLTGVGFETQNIRVGEMSSINITMKSTSTRLNEVVVTALGIRRNRNTLPYSAQQLGGDELNVTPTLNPISNLSGKVSGLQITQSNTMGGSTNIILRGIKSLTQSNQALFVVDGVPYNNDNQSRNSYDLGSAISDLNPDDIQSVSVLKGPAASALYGSRGSNGVIIITTKKGSKGQGAHVTATFGISSGSPDKSTLPVYQTQYGQGYGSAGASATYPDQSGFFYYRPASFSNGTPVTIVQTNNDAATGPAYDPSQMVYNWDAFTPGDPNFGKATPWQPAANHNPTDYFVTPITTTESINLDGTNDKGYYKIGLTHGNDKDFMPNSHLQKNLLDFGASYKILQNLSVGGELNYSDNAATNRYLYPYTGTSSPMTDFRQWWPTNVDIKQQKADFFNTSTNASWNWPTSAYLNNSLGSIKTPSYHDNLYWFAYKNFENDSRTRYFGNVHLDYQIAPFLSVMGRVSKDNYAQMVETRNDVGSQTVPFYTRYNENFDETNYDLLFNLDKNITSSLNLKALLGGNIRQVNQQSISDATSGGLVVPGFFALSNSVKTPPAPTEYQGIKEVDGVFAGATLSYKEIVTLDGTIRRDQSSTLPKNNNAYYYPSASINFQFAKLLPQIQWLSHGKVWGNYAQVGGDAPLYSISNTYLSETPFNGQTLFSTPGTNNNPNLVPESNRSIEVGIESSFLNDRLGFTVDYYLAKQINQIIPTSVSNATGFSTFYVNGGTVQNSGIEASLNLGLVRSRNFSWDMAINWSNNKQKVVSLYNNQSSYVVASYQNAIRLTAIPGLPYQLQGTDYKYLNGQRVIDATGHYEIADNNYSNLGTPNPDWVGGINNTFKYKNIALTFLVDARQGGKVYSLDMDYGSSSGLYPRTAGINDLGKPVRSSLADGGGIILKGVTEDGKPNTTRIDESDINNGDFSFSSAYGEADREFVYDASYIKLRELAITYSIPSAIFSNSKVIKGIDVSINGRNLWIIHKNLPYADPEQGQASGNASMGFQNGAYPTMRMIGAILKVKF